MRAIALLLAAALAAPATRAADDAGSAAPPPTEATFCAEELAAIGRRRDIFEREGLSPDEIDRRNAPHLRALLDCRERLRKARREADEAARDAAEVARRAGPSPTPERLAEVRREVRLERLASKPASALTPEERAELAQGTKAELAATHQALDRAHARDREFLRTVHSAIACYQNGRKDALEGQLATEEALVKVGSGDKNALYALRGQLRHAEEALARSRDFGRTHPLGLAPCDGATVALVAWCIGVEQEGKPPFALCDPEDVQQYLRFAR